MFDIKPIKTELAGAYHAVLDSVAREEMYLGLTEAPPLELITKRVQEFVEHDDPMFLAIDEYEVVGWCSIYTNQMPNFMHVGQLFIGVLSSWRGMGIGKALIANTLAKGWANGLERIELEVCVKNTPAVALYRTFGFTAEGVKRSAYFVENAYEDLMTMSLLREEDEYWRSPPFRLNPKSGLAAAV